MSPSPSPTGLAAALLTPADVPGSPQSSSQFSIDHIECVAPTDGALEQVEVDYPVGPQTGGPEPGLLVNAVVRFSGDKAGAFMVAERAQFDTCTTTDINAAIPTEKQLSPPPLGDESARYVYDQCDRFGCLTVDVIFIRKGSVVSVIANFSSILGTPTTPNTALTDRLAARAAAHLTSLPAAG
jgi:hypothetical protein